MADLKSVEDPPVKILVTGSSGHLGEALMRLLHPSEHDAVGVDLVEGPFTNLVGTIVDREFVARCAEGCDAVLHTATLHKPHVGTHSDQQFIDTNITGTLNLLEEAVSADHCRAFIFTSTTSTFGRALVPPPGNPAAWITEDVRPIPKNIYGVTKTAAEDLCELFHYRHDLPCLILKTSRFFPEEDDNSATRESFEDLNAKVNELLNRRLDIEDAARAHLHALDRANQLKFGRYILSSTTPFSREDLALVRSDPVRAVAQYVDFEEEYARRGWRLFDDFDRIYDNERARNDLGWEPHYNFAQAIECLRADQWPFSQLMRDVGIKRYHPGQSFDDGPFPVV